MITLYGGGENFGLPEVSPYVTKTEVQLQMAGLAFAKAVAKPADGPKQQIPFIDHDGVVVGDSTFIRAHLEAAFGVDLDAGLTPLQRAQAWAIERMCENSLSWAATHYRWVIPENFAAGPAHFFDDAPEAIRETLRAEVQGRVKATMRAVGMGRHSEPEILMLGSRSLEALSVMLGDKPYLFGDAPHGVDATVFGVLAYVVAPRFDSDLARAAKRFPNLIAYVSRMMARYFPGFAWDATGALEAAA